MSSDQVAPLLVMKHLFICQDKVLNLEFIDTGSSNLKLYDNIEGWDGVGGGREVQ